MENAILTSQMLEKTSSIGMTYNFIMGKVCLYKYVHISRIRVYDPECMYVHIRIHLHILFKILYIVI